MPWGIGVYSCPLGCDNDEPACGGGGGGGAYRYGCHDAPQDACHGKYSDAKSCNADSGCSWCDSVNVLGIANETSSCVTLETVRIWVNKTSTDTEWNVTCANVQQVA